KDLLRSTQQAIEAVGHVGGCRAEVDPHIGKVSHDSGPFHGRNPPTARMTSINTTCPTPSGSRTTPPLGSWISTGDAFSVIGTKAASPDSAFSRAIFSAVIDSGMPLRSRSAQR